ncbi:uncharacterized protein K02A2.6-like [Uranotaenia lowii]|uniref:uncharacterized protein K02A2.6-like n=1 Tax=Uranotaenia lowii TaxID=190385 RepID=UPI0024786EA4|nr:uncharacterized protein K02A2.6-like [Uranotaenia lowii]
MDPKVIPIFQPLRRVPIHLEAAVTEKLDELLRQDIIETKKGPATWVSQLVVANKANGSIRLCVDLRRVNQAVIRDRHPMPVIEDVLARIGRGKIWSVLDVMDAFFLLELDEETRNVMTFITHRGLYRFKRLPFGLVSAPEIFQRTMDEILADCEGAYCYLDDVGVEGSTVEEHDIRLNKCNIADVMSRLSTASPMPFDKAEEFVVREIVSAAAQTIALTWQEIEIASKEDDEIQQVIEALISETTDDLPLSYKTIFTELCSVNNVLVRGDRIVIPQRLQQRVLHLAHEGHPGMRMMKGHLRANVWWPKMDQHIEQFVKACRGCTLVSAPGPPEPMVRKELPS